MNGAFLLQNTPWLILTFAAMVFFDKIHSLNKSPLVFFKNMDDFPALAAILPR